MVEERENRLAEDVNNLPINVVINNDTKIGVITSGLCYQYTKQAVPDASILKLGMVYPLPIEKIKAFAKTVENFICY